MAPISQTRLLFLFLLSSVTFGQQIGRIVDTNTMRNIERILQSKNRAIKHDNNMDVEATYYPDCLYHKTVLAMNVERGKTRPDNIGIMLSGQESLRLEDIVMTWVDNTDFLEKIRNSTVFGCAFNPWCQDGKIVLSCTFDNPNPSWTSRPRTTTHFIPNTPPSLHRPKPYALTREMFQDILGELNSVRPDIHYDNEYFMDHLSASYWKCPFPQTQSSHYEVGTGRVEKTKEDNFGVIVELGRGVPYHDGRMRDAMKGFARKWSRLQFERHVKFGCSVDPDCHGDMILFCAFYPINSRYWPPYYPGAAP